MCFFGCPQQRLFSAKSANVGSVYAGATCAGDSRNKSACTGDTYAGDACIGVAPGFFGSEGTGTEGTFTGNAYTGAANIGSAGDTFIKGVVIKDIFTKSEFSGSICIRVTSVTSTHIKVACTRDACGVCTV